MAWLYVILAIIVIALVIVIANLKIVPQSKHMLSSDSVHILRRGRRDFTLKSRSLRE